MEYQLEERTRDMQDMLESCQTKVRLFVQLLDLHVQHLIQSNNCGKFFIRAAVKSDNMTL